MKWFSVVIAIMVAIQGISAVVELDWPELSKLSSLIQSAVMKKDLAILVDSTVQVLTLTPTDSAYYSIGYSYGEENVLFLNHANALTGNTLKIQLNPFRKIQEDCIYIPNSYKGMLVLYDGHESKRSLCDVSKIYRANPTGYKPLVSRSNDAITTNEIVHTSDHQTILEAEQYVRDKPRYPYVLDPHGYTREHVRGHSVTFVAGYYHYNQDTKMTKFVPKFTAEVFHDGENVVMDVLSDQWSNCVKCKGDPKKFAASFLLSKLDKTQPAQEKRE